MAGSLEFNKMAAAVLTAGVIASFCGFVASVAVHPKKLEQNAYVVPGVEAKPEAGGAGGAAGPEPVAPLLASANPQAGQEVAKKCLQCHSLEKGGPNKIGPNLFGIVGAPKGHEGSGFAYSPALLATGGNWTEEELNKFIFKPQGYAKGTKMTFAGLPKTQDRADLIKYLETLK
jgi:cytochrome c